MTRPNLSFFCELFAEPLAELFAEPAVIEALQALGAGVSLGIQDFSPQRTEVVQRLNEAGVPVTAWLLLPQDEGYWFNAENAAQAAARYREFRAWSALYGLRWARIGIDIEPDMREMQLLMQGEAKSLLPALVGRAFNGERVRRAQLAYATLVQQIHGDGYEVEAYLIPMISDERKAGSTALQRLFGLIDVPVDREVYMLYSSFLGSIGAALLWSYGPEAGGGIGVGSTGGGVDLGSQMPVIKWDAFARDLRLARQLTDEVYVFSLEGCVQQGYLAQLLDFDWEAPVTAPGAEDMQKVNALRRSGQTVMWLAAHPLVVLGGLALLRGLRRR
jgi:hypothetical protein